MNSHLRELARLIQKNLGPSKGLVIAMNVKMEASNVAGVVKDEKPKKFHCPDVMNRL